MKERIKYIIIALLLIVGALLLNHCLKPYITNSFFNSIPLDHLLIVPFSYVVILALGLTPKVPYQKRLLFTTIGTICYIIIANIFEIDVIFWKILISLIGTLATYLILKIFTTPLKSK